MNRHLHLLASLGALWLTCGAAAWAAGTRTEPLQTGLVAIASDGQRQAVFVMPTPNFTLGDNQSIHPQLTPAFKVTWSGSLNVLVGGRYTIRADAQVFLDGQEVQGRRVRLEAGERALRILYERQSGPARLQLQWESDDFALEPIPGSAYGHSAAPPETAVSARLVRGRQLVEELNCIGCHASRNTLFRGRRGPDLSDTGLRLKINWMYHWLGSSKHFCEVGVIPEMLPDAQKRAHVAAYLGGLKQPRPATKRMLSKKTGEASHGFQLMAGTGCMACHGEGGVSLKGLGSKWTVKQIARYLLDPLSINPNGRQPDMDLTKEEAQAIAEYLVKSTDTAYEQPAPSGNAALGRQIVVASGCLNCHTLLDHGAPLQNSFSAPAFEGLRAGQGCLAESPRGRAPHFGLTAEDRASLTAFLQSPDRSEAPTQDFKRLVNEYLCARCHALDAPPAVPAAVAPPPLTDAGNKLRASWLDQVLNQRKRARPWMSLRMPHYGEHNVGPMVNLFAAVAGATQGEGETIPEPTSEQVRAGARLLGTGEGGLRCITCHDFRGEGSGGDKRGPDLTELFARLRTDWLRRWLLDPVRSQADTAMPACLIQTPSAQREQAVTVLTQALWAGKNLPVPQGLREEARAHYLLVAGAPVVARTFMPDVSGRAFAVGLPGQLNYCFDAQICRVAYAWTGDFLDMKAVWTGRSGTAVLLGPRFYSALSPISLRMGEHSTEPRVRFRGYELVGGVPEFLYNVDDVAVRERITRADKGVGLVRTFDLGERERDAWLLAGTADSVTITCSAGPFEDGRLRIPAGKPVRIELQIMAK